MNHKYFLELFFNQIFTNKTTLFILYIKLDKTKLCKVHYKYLISISPYSQKVEGEKKLRGGVVNYDRHVSGPRILAKFLHSNIYFHF